MKLDGFSVVAAVKAKATLGDPMLILSGEVGVIIYQRANAQEREALAAFAKHMGGKLLANVGDWSARRWRSRSRQNITAARFWRRAISTVQTRSINDNGHLCGNDRPLPATDAREPCHARGSHDRQLQRQKFGQNLDAARQAQRVCGHILNQPHQTKGRRGRIFLLRRWILSEVDAAASYVCTSAARRD